VKKEYKEELSARSQRAREESEMDKKLQGETRREEFTWETSV
jgi:hypothetical protein